MEGLHSHVRYQNNVAVPARPSLPWMLRLGPLLIESYFFQAASPLHHLLQRGGDVGVGRNGKRCLL